jgi:hypothetical protein
MAFVHELRYQLRYVLASVYTRVRDIDLTDLILDECAPLAVQHVQLYLRCGDWRTQTLILLCAARAHTLPWTNSR